MSGRRAIVTLFPLAVLAMGCSGDTPAPTRSEQAERSTQTPAPESVVPDPVSESTRNKVARFVKKAEFIDQVGPGFQLRDVQYTSATDAVAWFDGLNSGDTVISTTNDNWSHASQLLIPYDLAENVSYVPLGDGAVAIKAGDQFSRRSAPPFVLYVTNEVRPLQVGEPRPLDADSDLLEIDSYGFFWAIDAPVRYLAPDDSMMLKNVWAADIEAGHIFPVTGPPPGDLQRSVLGREGAILSIDGYRGIDEIWRFRTSTDRGQTWQQTDVQLPLGRQRILPDGLTSPYALGPASLQALAVADYGIDTPHQLRKLWRTDDEKRFIRARLPQDRMPFAGMAFASDGALLLAEVADTECSISPVPCTRRGRIWRLAPDGKDIALLRDGPALFGSHGSDLLDADGGVIVAQSGYRTLAVSATGTHGPRSLWEVRRPVGVGLSTKCAGRGGGLTHLRHARYRALELPRKLGGVRWADRDPAWHLDQPSSRPSGRQRSELSSSTASTWPYLLMSRWLRWCGGWHG